jgi:hypothetical protein
MSATRGEAWWGRPGPSRSKSDALKQFVLCPRSYVCPRNWCPWAGHSVVARIEDERITILVARVAHRREAYRLGGLFSIVSPKFGVPEIRCVPEIRVPEIPGSVAIDFSYFGRGR